MSDFLSKYVSITIKKMGRRIFVSKKFLKRLNYNFTSSIRVMEWKQVFSYNIKIWLSKYVLIILKEIITWVWIAEAGIVQFSFRKVAEMFRICSILPIGMKNGSKGEFYFLI